MLLLAAAGHNGGACPSCSFPCAAACGDVDEWHRVWKSCWYDKVQVQRILGSSPKPAPSVTLIYALRSRPAGVSVCLTYASCGKPVHDDAARHVRQVQIESILGRTKHVERPGHDKTPQIQHVGLSTRKHLSFSFVPYFRARVGQTGTKCIHLLRRNDVAKKVGRSLDG